MFIHSYINEQAMGYILVGSLTSLKTLVYKINGAKYIKVDIKYNGELNPGIIPMFNIQIVLWMCVLIFILLIY